MSRDRSIVTQAMMKSILPHHPAEEWEQLTKEALRIHDSMVPADAGGKNSPAPMPLALHKKGDEIAGFRVVQVKDWDDNVSVKLSGGQLGDGTWVKFYRGDMADARQLDQGRPGQGLGGQRERQAQRRPARGRYLGEVLPRRHGGSEAARPGPRH